MHIGYLECFAGISGDMLLGALVDAGVPVDLLEQTARSLNIGAELKRERVDRSGVRSTRVHVEVDGQHFLFGRNLCLSGGLVLCLFLLLVLICKCFFTHAEFLLLF